MLDSHDRQAELDLDRLVRVQLQRTHSARAVRVQCMCSACAVHVRAGTPPALARFIASAIPTPTTPPRFGLGINPLGPSTRAALASAGSMSGVAKQRSKSMTPASTCGGWDGWWR